MKKILILFISLICLVTKSQSTGPYAITVTGGSHSDGNFSVDYSIGEVFTGKIGDEQNIFLTQGVIQPSIVNSVDITTPVLNEQISIYPNPFINDINIKFENINETKVNVKIIDITGKLRIDNNYNIKSKIFEISVDVTDFNNGIYFVTVNSENKVLKRTKLYKK